MIDKCSCHWLILIAYACGVLLSGCSSEQTASNGFSGSEGQGSLSNKQPLDISDAEAVANGNSAAAASDGPSTAPDYLPLVHAALDRDLERYADLLSMGHDPNKWDKYGRSGINAAASIPDEPKWIHLALRHGGDPNRMPPKGTRPGEGLYGAGFSPLHIACTQEDCEFNVRLLVEAGGDVNKPNAYGMTPLALAVDHGLYVVAGYLIKNGANPDVKCEGGIALRDKISDALAPDYPFQLTSDEKQGLRHLESLLEEE